VEIGAEDVTEAANLGNRLIDLHNTGGLTAGVGGQLVRDAAAAEAMRRRCLALFKIHERMAWAYKLRANSTTSEMIEAADRSIGNLQAELKNAES
jgi:hypothetical protein